ncbi:DNA polymerase I [Reinekea marinisedimentorum]|uniref:DNA polymerase I n=1 Tax=Reinekea marinisedimentorum TaxID=230495 RepID=A0A4V2UK86_9GAMM|nr:DNA polymerase I [Reinekea marinisedimentorum]TCS43232.1 DNA polymerase I [Reinekea marinisedimentorum]
MSNASAPIVLVDGSSYLFRAFHALPPLANSEGMQTGAIKGVVSMLRKLITDYAESEIVVVFDAKGPTFRNEMFPDYKANRPPMPEELREQIEPIHQTIEAMGLPLLCVSGVEADDVIGTLAEQASQQNIPCVVSTGDKDMAQLVTEHVTLINTMKNEVLDIAGVEKKYGFGPDKMIDYLALMGDKVDNIPGVPGVGEKTALALIQGLGGLDDIYSRLDEVATLTFRGAKTMAAKLETHKEMAYLSYELATIKLDVELDVQLTELKKGEADEAALKQLFERFQFRTWLREMAGEESAPGKAAKPAAKKAVTASLDAPVLVEPAEVEYQLVTTLDELDEIVTLVSQTKQLAYVPVLAKAHYMTPQWIGLALACKAGKAWYIPFVDNEQPALAATDVFEKLAPLWQQHAIVKTGYDIKADHHWFRSLGWKPARLAHDVQVMAFVYDSTLKRDKSLSNHYSHLSLDNLFIAYLEKSPKTVDDFLGKAGKRQLSASQVTAESIGPWWAERADLLLRLGGWLQQGLEIRGLARVYEEIERPLSRVLACIEGNGVVLDTDYIHSLSSDFKARLAAIEQQAHELAGIEFNLDSPKQLAEILFTKMELPVLSKTASGAPSTNEEVLTDLAKDHELPQLILQSRHLRKLVGTYTDPLPTLVLPAEGSNDLRLHTTYNQTGAQTGRLSSNDPNLQNIPIRTKEGRSIRKAFVAPEGYSVVAADYSQIELRIMTHLSQDANLITAFKEGKDIHRATAAEVMGVDETSVTDEQRRSAKAINFGLIYGMSAFGLAKQLNISRTEAKQYVDAYFERYPGVRRYMDETRAEAAETGYVETIFGRRLYLPAIQSSNQIARKGAERTAINAPMQGTAADIIKMAMVDVQNWLAGSGLRARMIMQVHDELVFEVHDDDKQELIEGIRFRMQHCANLDVPLVVDIGEGASWDEAH